MYIKWKSLSCVRLCDPMDYTVYGILQDRILEWVAVFFSRGSSQTRDQTQVSHVAGGFFTGSSTTEALIAQLVESTCSAGDPGLIPGSGRSTGESKGYPLQYSDLEYSMDCIVRGITKSRTWMSNFHFSLFMYINLCELYI